MRLLLEFFRYAQERYLIMKCRDQGRTWPWTDDQILQKYRFCNVFREDDTTTIWIRRNLREPLVARGDEQRLILAMCAARFINRIETLERLKFILLEEGWNTKLARREMARLKKEGKPIVTAAYMIKTPTGLDKGDGVDAVLSKIKKMKWPATWPSLQEAHSVFKEIPFFGPFLAYEVVTDLRHTPVLNGANDIMTWAYPGPGAARGLSRVEVGVLGRYIKNLNVEVQISRMRDILEASPGYWPLSWPAWEMRDVEHTLCEFDKYERARTGEGEPKQLYRH